MSVKKISFKIGDLTIGGDSPILIQTMCNTSTNDIEGSVKQCEDVIAKGADLVRLTTQGVREVNSLAEIKSILRGKGINTPLVADVHFSSKVAIAAASVAEKVRINPGNFAKEHSQALSEFDIFISECKKYGTAVRIGINHGSLGERITNLYGNTPKGMMMAALEWMDMCIERDFYNVVFSLKASNTVVMVEAYRLLMSEMVKRELIFPIHLGVTEAGCGDTGRMKSAVGIATLLNESIGDTIRVSLTEDPVNEIIAGKMIVEKCAKIRAENRLNNYVKCVDNQTYNANSWEELIISVSCDYSSLLLDKKIDDFNFKASINGKELSEKEINDIKDDLLQAARRRFTKPEYISCPGCGRTLYNLQKSVEDVKKATAHLKGVTIAIMGCIVNGPGEMADADYGYVGEGGGKVTLYRQKEVVARSVPEDEAVEMLLKIIESDKK